MKKIKKTVHNSQIMSGLGKEGWKLAYFYRAHFQGLNQQPNGQQIGTGLIHKAQPSPDH